MGAAVKVVRECYELMSGAKSATVRWRTRRASCIGQQINALARFNP